MAAIYPTVHRWVQNAREAPEEFWASAANELPWFRKWTAFSNGTSELPLVSWAPRPTSRTTASTTTWPTAGTAPALIYVNERGERRRFTYRELTAEVERIFSGSPGPWASARATASHLYAYKPEAIMAMLATRTG